MKKYTLLFSVLILLSCIFNDDDLPNQFTSVEGYVTDYYSKKPISDLPLVVNNRYTFCIIDCKYNIMDTLYTNKEGHYYFEFFNDSDRIYNVQVLQTENYVKSISTKIFEGEKNSINFPLKPFRTLNLNLYNQNKIFNSMSVFDDLNEKETVFAPSNDSTFLHFKIIPEFDNIFEIYLRRFIGANKVDTVHSEKILINIGNKDTTINYTF